MAACGYNCKNLSNNAEILIGTSYRETASNSSGLSKAFTYKLSLFFVVASLQLGGWPINSVVRQ